jgi:hypothetical protein
MAVQRDVVVNQLAGIEAKANDEGLIPAFNVFVNILPTTFWNGFSERFLAAVTPSRRDEAERGLVTCARECGYNTGYGIITSPEFKAVVEPMVTEGAKDILRGAFAVFTAWGWAKSGIVQIKEGERMIIRAMDYYEADGAPGDHRAFMIRGVSSAFFDLAYGIPYPNGLGTFDCVQTRGLESGDQFGEFEVTKI